MSRMLYLLELHPSQQLLLTTLNFNHRIFWKVRYVLNLWYTISFLNTFFSLRQLISIFSTIQPVLDPQSSNHQSTSTSQNSSLSLRQQLSHISIPAPTKAQSASTISLKTDGNHFVLI